MEKYNSNILKLLSKVKNDNKEFELNATLKKENEYKWKQIFSDPDTFNELRDRIEKFHVHRR